MIAGIEGKLVKLDTEFCLIQIGSVRYEVMLPAYCVAALADRIGTDISLCTLEYFEGAPGGGSFVPRMVGFLTENETGIFYKIHERQGHRRKTWPAVALHPDFINRIGNRKRR